MPGILRLDDELRRSIARHLEQFEIRTLAAGDQRRAAVAITLVPMAEGWSGSSRDAAFVLTQRAGSLSSHGGQWALPGGRVDGDETVEEAALRELEEEVGLRASSAAVLGRLDDYSTRSGFLISPVVVWIDDARGMTPDPREVAAAYRVPLGQLGASGNPVLSESSVADRPLLSLSILDSMVFAPTAAVLHQFWEVAIRGRSTRVAHFDQPRFAWR